MDKMQIDGYYYDPVKKRHFRLTNNNNHDKYHPHRNLHHNHNGLVSPSSSSPLLSPSLSPIKNIYSELTRVHRSYPQNGLNAQECLLSGRFTQMQSTGSKRFWVGDYKGDTMNGPNCDYLIGEPEHDSLYGVWSSNDEAGSVIQQLVLNENGEVSRDRCSIINAFPCGTRIEDLCMVMASPCPAIMCLTNHTNSNLGAVTTLNIHYVKNSRQDCSLNYELQEPSYSCCSYTIQTLAIGSDNQIRLFLPIYRGENQCDDHKLLKINGKVTALKFSLDGRILYAGTNNGFLVSHAINNQKRIANVNLHTKTINYLYPLENGNQLIVSSHENKLLLIDNRNFRSPVISFPHHVNDCKKLPVSVDESVDVLCSSGQDYKVRLWSIKSGKLLYEIPPPDEYFTNPLTDTSAIIHSWYSNSWKISKGQPSPMVVTCMRDQIKLYRRTIDT